MKRNMVILGAPGSGKGTQAKKLHKEFGWIHISTGDILRAEIEKESDLGIKVREYVHQGKLVPDEVIIELIKQKLSCDNAESGFILDGFPRNVVQAEKLDKILHNMQIKLDTVLFIYVDKQEIVRRVSKRFICQNCGPIIVDNPDTDRCPNCSGKIYRREDDDPETVTHRLEVFEKKTRSLINYYKGRKLFKSVDGDGTIDEVFERVKKAL